MGAQFNQSLKILLSPSNVNLIIIIYTQLCDYVQQKWKKL